MCVLWAWKQKGEIKRREKKTLCFRCYWWHRSRILSRDMWLDLAALMWGHFYLAENKQIITTTHLTFILLKVIEWAYCMIDCIFLLPRPSLSSAGSTGRSDGEYQRRLLWTLLGNKQLQLRILTWSFFNTVAQKSNLKMSLFASKHTYQSSSLECFPFILRCDRKGPGRPSFHIFSLLCHGFYMFTIWDFSFWSEPLFCF